MRSQRENRPILRKASSCARHAIDHSICECPSDSTRASQASSSCVSATVTTPSLGRARPGTRRPSPMPWSPAKTPISTPGGGGRQAGPILPVEKRPADDRPQQRDPLQDPRTVGAAAGRAQQYHATDARIGMAREHAQDHQPAQAVADEMDHRRLDGGDEIRQCARVVSQPAADRRIREAARIEAALEQPSVLQAEGQAVHPQSMDKHHRLPRGRRRCGIECFFWHVGMFSRWRGRCTLSGKHGHGAPWYAGVEAHPMAKQ